jgi:MFS family permease
MQLVMGWGADRFHLRWFYAACFAIWSLACGFTGFAGSLGILLILRVALGIGEAIYLPGGMKVVGMFFDPGNRGLASGLMNCGTRAGLAVGAPLIAALVMRFGWKHSFFVIGFTSTIWIIPWLIAFPKRAGVPPRRAPGGGFLQMNGGLAALCLGQLCYSYYWYLLVTWLPNYLVESHHMTITQAGGYVVIPYAIFAVSEPFGGWVADRLIQRGLDELRTRKTIITIGFLTSLLLLPASHVSDDLTAVLLIGGASLVGLSTANMYALLQRIAPADAMGLWTGMLNFVGNISGIVAPVVTGVLLQQTGSYYPGFVVSVVVLLAGVPVYWWLVKEKQRSV